MRPDGATHGAAGNPRSRACTRASLEDPEKILSRERHHVRVLECRDRRRARRVVEARQLAEDRVALPLHGHHDLMPFLIGYGDLDPA
jgi:hypothetical protein